MRELHLGHEDRGELHAPAALVLVLHQELGVLALLHARRLFFCEVFFRWHHHQVGEAAHRMGDQQPPKRRRAKRQTNKQNQTNKETKAPNTRTHLEEGGKAGQGDVVAVKVGEERVVDVRHVVLDAVVGGCSRRGCVLCCVVCVGGVRGCGLTGAGWARGGRN